MKKLYFWSGVFILSLVLFIPILLGFGIRYLPGNDQPSLDRVVDLNNKTVVAQTFQATGSNLAMIGLSIKNPNLLNKDDLIFNLYEENQLVRTITLSGKNIPDGEFVKLRFDPVTDSNGKSFRFEFRAPNTTLNPLEPFLSNQSGDTTQVLTINGDVKNGMMSYVAYYKPGNFLLEPVKIYGDVFSQLSRDPIFAVFFSLMILAFLGCLIFI